MEQSVALIHVHRVESTAVRKALDQALKEWKHSRTESIPVPPNGPLALEKVTSLKSNQICYLIGARCEQWTTVIQAFEDRECTPFLADLSNRLSERLQTHSLAVLLHEGMILFYNLDYRGTPRDGYSSHPTSLTDKKLSDAEILKERHQPKAFTPLLPKEIKIDQLMELLNAGWWHAYDTKQLDETGEPQHEDALVEEDERLTKLGGMLQLNGKAGYPFAHWRTTKLVDWTRFVAVFYETKSKELPLV
jgi:hypothetical protein